MFLNCTSWRNGILLLACLYFFSFPSLGQRLEWAGKIGGSTSDYASSLKVGTKGDVFICGTFEGAADFDPGPGTFLLTSDGFSDFFIARYQSNGTLVWARNFGSPGEDYDLGRMALDQEDNLYLTGGFNNKTDFDPGSDSVILMAKGYEDIFIARYSPDGHLSWVRQFGFSGYGIGADLAVDKAGDLIATGIFQGCIDFDPSPAWDTINFGDYMSTFVLKMDAEGDMLWGRYLQSYYWAQVSSLATDPVGNIVLGGSFLGALDADPGTDTLPLFSEGNYDGFLVKLDPSGNLMWGRSFGGPRVDRLNALTQDPQGNIYCTGTFEDTADFDPGPAQFLQAAELFNSFALKLDADGQFTWAKSWGGWGVDGATDIEVDQQRNVYTCGYFNTLADFDPGTGSLFIEPVSRDAFVSSLDESGNFRWAARVGGAPRGDNIPATMVLDKTERLWLTGYFLNYTDCDPGPDIFNVSSNGGTDIFWLCWSLNQSGGANHPNENAIAIFPNPFRDQLTLLLPSHQKFVKGEMRDQLGCPLYPSPEISFPNPGTQLIDTRKMPPGIYWLEIQTDEGVFNYKILKTPE